MTVAHGALKCAGTGDVNWLHVLRENGMPETPMKVKHVVKTQNPKIVMDPNCDQKTRRIDNRPST